MMLSTTLVGTRPAVPDPPSTPVEGSSTAAVDDPATSEDAHRESTEGESKASQPGESRRRIVVPATTDGLEPQRELDEEGPGFATAVVIDRDRDPVNSDGLSQVIARVPGAKVRSLGGLGQFSAVQLRGSSAQQVQLFLEGVPLNDSFGGLVDLSSQNLDGLDRVEVHRGYIPIVFGGATLGGAINLVSREPDPGVTWGAAGGYGSFTTREAQGRIAAHLNRRSTLGAVVSYAGSDGDYPYFDDGGTPRIEDDDGTSRRQNNGYDRVFGQVRFDHRRRKVRFTQLLRAGFRDRGVPGTASHQSTRTHERSSTARAISRIDVERLTSRGGRVSWVLGLTANHRAYSDPLGQVGLSVDDQRMWSVDAYLSPRLHVPLWRGAELGVVADARTEHVDVDERNVPDDPTVLASGDATRNRWGFGVGIELDQRLLGDFLRVVPAIRVDAFDSRFAVPEGEGEDSDEGDDRLDLAVSPRLGARARLLPWLQLRASVGRYFRVPSLFELFGDRGFVVGNEGLAPESGVVVDGGFVAHVERGRWSLVGQVAGFSTWSHDLIQFVQTGLVMRPINLPGAWLRGVELGSSLQLFGRVVEVDATYTFLDSRNRSPEVSQHNQPLPGRPAHEVSARAEVGSPLGRGWVRLEPRIGYTIDVISATSLDLANRYRLPARVLHGLGFELHWVGGVHLGFDLRNVADRRVTYIVPAAGPPDPVPVPISDFIGYPLPGRSFFVRLAVDSRLFTQRKKRT